jgi:hypothetical protein
MLVYFQLLTLNFGTSKISIIQLSASNDSMSAFGATRYLNLSVTTQIYCKNFHIYLQNLN